MKTVYVVGGVGWEYNDQTYDRAEGINPIKTFTDKKKAEKYAQKQNALHFAQGINVWDYTNCDTYALDEITHLDTLEVIKKIGHLVEFSKEFIKQNKLKFVTNILELNYDAWQGDIPQGLKKKDYVLLANVFSRVNFYEVSETEFED